jgi:hypothetical protein
LFDAYDTWQELLPPRLPPKLSKKERLRLPDVDADAEAVASSLSAYIGTTQMRRYWVETISGGFKYAPFWQSLLSLSLPSNTHSRHIVLFRWIQLRSFLAIIT